MIADQKAARALDLRNLQVPSGLPIRELKFEDYTDSSGEPTLRVWVVLDEAAEVEKLSGEAIGELKSAIRENLRQSGVDVFPYIFLAKPSELADNEE